MKAVVFLGERKLEIMDWADPTPGPEDVIVEMKASGMCGTDLHHYRSPAKTEAELYVEGHEPSGVVAEVGSAVTKNLAQIGDRVMVHHYDGCRVCHHCRSGWTQMCETGKKRTFGATADGGHTKYLKVPAHTLVKLRDDLSFKIGAAISCGTGTAFGALKRIDLAGDETVAIFGQGPVGQSATQFAKAMGARVIALDISPERLAKAGVLGADVLINPLENDPVTAIKDLTRGIGADKALECSSNPDARRQSVEAVRRWGTTCLVGVRGTMEFNVDNVILGQKNIVGSWTFSKNLQDDCANFVGDRKIDVETLFTDEFKLEEADRAYRLFDTQKVGKGVFMLG